LRNAAFPVTQWHIASAPPIQLRDSAGFSPVFHILFSY